MLSRLLSMFRRHRAREAGRRFCVISHPKSGRTWLRVMLDELGIEADYTHAGPEKKGWLHYQDLTTNLKHPYERVLILTRDPRDSSVSGFHQMTRRSHESHQFSGTMGEFLRDPRLGVEKAAHFNLLWARYAAGRADAMMVSYERLKADAAGTLAEIARFFGIAASPAKIAEVVERNSFAQMQERERSGELGKSYGRPLKPRDPNDPTTFKVRRGEIGSHRDELAPEDVAYSDETLAGLDYFREMERLGAGHGAAVTRGSLH